MAAEGTQCCLVTRVEARHVFLLRVGAGPAAAQPLCSLGDWDGMDGLRVARRGVWRHTDHRGEGEEGRVGTETDTERGEGRC